MLCWSWSSGNFHFDLRSSPLELVPDETFLGKQCLQISNIITANCWIFSNYYNASHFYTSRLQSELRFNGK